MVKVSPWKGVVRFGKRGKLNPRYVRTFKVLAKVRDVAYKLDLPQELIRVHNTFHVSNLKKYYADKLLVVSLDGLHIDDAIRFGGVTDLYQEPSEMSSAVIPVSADFTEESARVNVVVSPAGVFVLIIHSDSESDVSENPPSSENAPLQIVPLVHVLTRLPAILVLHGQEIPFGCLAMCHHHHLYPVQADHLLPRKRFKGSLAASYQDISIEDSIELTVKERLEEYKEVIQGMYEYLLEVPVMRFKELEEKHRVLKDRVVTAQTERTNLPKRVRPLEMSELSLKDSLRADREAYARVQRQLGFVIKELR
nr:putative reverse transcriptase domain-containing protein [Tanacetum cinerariifolium]